MGAGAGRQAIAALATPRKREGLKTRHGAKPSDQYGAKPRHH
jgi:hypothetical protein